MEEKVKKIMIDLCAPPRCSCPKLEMDFDTFEVTIFDDYSCSVRMSFRDFHELGRRFNEYV